MNEHEYGRVVRALVRPGVYLALKRGRWKTLAGAYFWAVSPLVRWASWHRSYPPNGGAVP